MKPLHVGLLVVGAAIAGGLAVRMTQAPGLQPHAAITVTPKAAPAETVPRVAAPPSQDAVAPQPPLPQEAAAPPPVYSEPHTSPVPARKAKKPVEALKEVAKNVPPPYNPPSSVEAPQPVQSVPEPVPTPDTNASLPPEPPPVIAPRRVTLSANTTISARMIESLSSDKVRPGDTFQATLADPLIADGLVIAERGARVTGKVVDSNQAGKFQGTSRLELALVNIYSSDGQKVAISTSSWKKQGDNQRNGDAAKIGGGAALGAIIGAIAGGGKGAAIGAGVGGAAGTGAVMIPQSKPVTVPTETIIKFRLSAPVTITERT